MKQTGIEPNIYIYTQMIAVYASTNRIAELPSYIKTVYEQDMWKIVEQCSAAG